MISETLGGFTDWSNFFDPADHILFAVERRWTETVGQELTTSIFRAREALSCYVANFLPPRPSLSFFLSR